MTDDLDRLQAALADRYVLERELGRGGMATVYLTQDLKHHRLVALKVLHPELAAALGPDRFLREIGLTARLDHPHILPVFDSGEADGLLWYTMPYVPGESLRDRLRHEVQLSVDEAIRVAREVAEALDCAHRHGIVHRDIKPENILLSEGHARVADFGVARAVETAAGDRLTETGLALGTPAYMSPEQASGGSVAGRSDIYSLGAVVYEMLAGEPPYTGPTAQAVIAKRFSEPVPHLGTVRAVSPRLEDAVTRALAKSPADRFATAGEFTAALAASATPAQAVATARPMASRVRVAAVTLGLGLLIGLGVLFAVRRSHPGVESVAGPKRLAVLPFENLGDSADAYFADGITDEVRGKLASLPGLRVIARTSSSQYRGTRKAPQEIGRELGVDYLLTATVRWEKPANGRSRVRVMPELIQAAEATTRWQQPFDAPLTDVFQVQGDIAGRVAQALGVALTTGERERLVHRPTDNLAAYDLFLQGRQFWNQRTPSALQTAARYFEQAIARDSTYAEAYAGLAENYALLPAYEVSPPREAYPKAKTAALRALTLDSTLGQAVAVLARMRMEYDWDWGGAEREYRRALALAPSYPTAHELYAIYLGLLGRHEEALAEIERARALDPLSRIIGSMEGVLLDLSRRHDEAIAQFRRTLELDPDFAHAHYGLGLAYLAKGMRPEGIAELETAVRLTGRRAFTGELAYAYGVSGQHDRALALVRELEERSRREYLSPVTVALAYTGLGDKDGAFRWLERAADLRDPQVLALRVDWLFEPLRSDPRFTRLLTRVGLH